MVKIEYYTAERIENPCPTGEVSPQLFHQVRNAVVHTCRKHGPTGPMGMFPVGRSFKDSGEFLEAWELGDPDPSYYVIDDQYNDIDQYQCVEVCKPADFTVAWTEDLMATLAKCPGWGVGVANITEGYLLIFPDKLMLTGSLFKATSDLPSVVAAAKASLMQ